ncbi:unnamed protein product [Phytophthora fragariaefolia]|uniref:Unnamed protein product n=1 Tax=Phytophthora fragariaefolia TaxID=1490495 RepID=A0A9W7D2R3_9STRA|nr:unnamed protein product [Phytophthora fragariaefolia]
MQFVRPNTRRASYSDSLSLDESSTNSLDRSRSPSTCGGGQQEWFMGSESQSQNEIPDINPDGAMESTCGAMLPPDTRVEPVSPAASTTSIATGLLPAWSYSRMTRGQSAWSYSRMTRGQSSSNTTKRAEPSRYLSASAWV